MDINEYKKSLAGEIQYAKDYIEKNKERYNATEYFPCEIDSLEGSHQVTIDSSNGLFFFEIFAEYGLYGNGYCWEGVIQQILEKDMPQLLERTEFDSEGDAFVAYFESKKDQKRLAKHIHDICIDKSKLESYLKNIDRDRIDD